MRMHNGALIVYKEKGFTSFDAVAKLRGILRQKKIGHTGTLDPDAEGVLIILLGNATRLCDILTYDSKQYECTIRFGAVSDTDDASGNVIIRDDSPFEGLGTDEIRSKIEEALSHFRGEIEQIPPLYSAIKINGKKLYDYARSGGEIPEITPRRITISNLTLLSVDPPFANLLIECSKGTYIRSLCRDIGEEIGCGALMQKLLRSRNGEFSTQNALTLSEIESLTKDGRIDKYIIPVDSLLKDYPAAAVKEKYERMLLNGNKLGKEAFSDAEGLKEGDIIRVYSGGRFLALYSFGAVSKPYKMFLESN